VATFVGRLRDADFAPWFNKPRQDLERLTQRPTVSSRRIERVQRALIDLMDCLDPHGVRIPRNRREKLVSSDTSGSVL
jgi:hypothetical protein